eukprot:CAMPEP_0179032336 /NCGR_PEP_ID=MMETSP0796-20121207/11530_1 /TAXON_ID=73915 /ORGANISM="Pyrodinium bahamense, Strain pbaha01" /LENGTH=112 /DNA_ID=CAMNT_0020728549 /DNA_START=297 /DNA_END=635 /DNA_ORIENTATION=+
MDNLHLCNVERWIAAPDDAQQTVSPPTRSRMLEAVLVAYDQKFLLFHLVFEAPQHSDNHRHVLAQDHLASRVLAAVDWGGFAPLLQRGLFEHPVDALLLGTTYTAPGTVRNV